MPHDPGCDYASCLICFPQHRHVYSKTGKPLACPVAGCWFNSAPCELPAGLVQPDLFGDEDA